MICKRLNSMIICVLILDLLMFVIGCKRDETKLFRSKEPVTIVGKYMAWACGDYTPQVMPVKISDHSINVENINFGLTFWINEGMRSPDIIDEIRVPGNMFVLDGYCYYEIINGIKSLKPRFDLISVSAQ